MRHPVPLIIATIVLLFLAVSLCEVKTASAADPEASPTATATSTPVTPTATPVPLVEIVVNATAPCIPVLTNGLNPYYYGPVSRSLYFDTDNNPRLPSFILGLRYQGAADGRCSGSQTFDVPAGVFLIGQRFDPANPLQTTGSCFRTAGSRRSGNVQPLYGAGSVTFQGQPGDRWTCTFDSTGYATPTPFPTATPIPTATPAPLLVVPTQPSAPQPIIVNVTVPTQAPAVQASSPAVAPAAALTFRAPSTGDAGLVAP